MSGLFRAQVPRIKGHLNEDLHFLLGKEVLPPIAEGERGRETERERKRKREKERERERERIIS